MCFPVFWCADSFFGGLILYKSVVGGGGHFFSPNPSSGAGFCREKNSKNSGRGGQNFGHLVLRVQRTKFCDYWPTLHAIFPDRCMQSA